MTLPELSKPERALWEAFPRGAWVDLRAGDPERDDLTGGGSWGTERTVRGEIVTALLLGACKPEPGRFPAVRLRGARISGRIDLMGAVISHALVLEYCWFEQALRFVEATTRTVRIISSRLPAFNGARMRTEGIVNFYQSVIEGNLRLDRARIDGEITLRGAHVGDGTGEAIAGAGLTVNGDMECNAGFTAHGRITLRRARIGGLLTFRDAAARAYHVSVRYPEEARSLWQKSVPRSGQSATVQGELLRVVEKLRDEAQRNGNINWNEGHQALIAYLQDTLLNSGPFDQAAAQEIEADLQRLSRYDYPESSDAPYDRLADRVVEWCRAHPEPLPHIPHPDVQQ